jgi:hypothetical protein
MAAPTVLGCFSLASGIDPATQTKVARLAVATAAMTLVITLATTIADIVRNGFSVMALANPVVAILLCVVGVPSCTQQGMAKRSPNCMLGAVVGHFTNSVCSIMAIGAMWWMASNVLALCTNPTYNCQEQFVNGTECVIAVPGWGGRVMTTTIPKASCDGFGAGPVVFSLLLLVLAGASVYAGVISCKLKPLLQFTHNMQPGAQVVGTTGQVQIVQPTIMTVQPTVVTATVVKAA